MPSWLLLQLADSAFPTGGFAHSAGLEAAWQAGEVDEMEALERFLSEALWQAGCAALPLASSAHEDPAALAALDARADAFLANHVQNRASRTQGRAFIETAARIFPALQPLRAQAQAIRQHHAPIFGAGLRALGLPLPEMQRLLLFSSLRTPLSAAVRLGLCGTQRAQALQAQLAPALEEVATRCAPLRAADVAQTAPHLDVLAAGHDRLYSRLFVS